MNSHKDMMSKAWLLEDGRTASHAADNARGLLRKQRTERRKAIRHAQYLLVFNVAIGLLLGLAVASFCVKPGFGYPWIPHHLQRVFVSFFAAELILLFVIPPVVLLWRFGGRIDADFEADQSRDSVCVILLAVCEFTCGLWATGMSAFSIYTGKTLAAKDAGSGLITLCSFGMGACLVFSLLANPKFRIAKKLGSCAVRQEAELSVIGAIINMLVALSAALALTQCSIPVHTFSVLGAAEYPAMFLGAFLLVRSLAHLVTEFLHHRKAAFSSIVAHRE